MFVDLVGREGQECRIIDEVASSQAQFSKGLPPGEKRRYRLVADILALV